MYKLLTITGPEVLAAATAPPPLGPGWPTAAVATLTRLEVWGSSFTDEGPDFTEFRAYADAELLDTRRILGY